jgi:hypothetical protein
VYESEGTVNMARKYWQLAALLAALLCGLGAAHAGPLEDARAMVDAGRDLLDKAEKAKGKKRTETFAEGLKQYAKAYLLIKNQRLDNDAPELLAEIGEAIATANRAAEVAEMRQALLKQAIDAAVGNEMTKSWDFLAALRDLDPREWTVEYALGVIGQRMGSE